MELINFSYSDIVLPLSLSIDSHTLIIGPSGSGKTTLLKAMLGTLKHSGTLAINGAQSYFLEFSR
jgi:ABC-type Mn2+/Zn2+ transport system ATPase subunit